jgi:hypothetical protein
MTAGANRLRLILVRNPNRRHSILTNPHMNIHRPAAHLAVLDVTLLPLGALDQKLDLLPAVGTVYVDRFKAKICHRSAAVRVSVEKSP